MCASRTIYKSVLIKSFFDSYVEIMEFSYDVTCPPCGANSNFTSEASPDCVCFGGYELAVNGVDCTGTNLILNSALRERSETARPQESPAALPWRSLKVNVIFTVHTNHFA